MNAPNELPKDRGLLKLTTACLLFLLAALPVNAQQINGVPGSPNSTTTIESKILPPPPAPFGGVINLNASQSKRPPTVVAPKGAPNVLLIMTNEIHRAVAESDVRAALHGGLHVHSTFTLRRVNLPRSLLRASTETTHGKPHME
jgi:hypothetical protein